MAERQTALVAELTGRIEALERAFVRLSDATGGGQENTRELGIALRAKALALAIWRDPPSYSASLDAKQVIRSAVEVEATLRRLVPGARDRLALLNHVDALRKPPSDEELGLLAKWLLGEPIPSAALVP